MKTIAIFGGNGYLGMHMANYLRQRGYDYDIFDVQDRPNVTCRRYCQADVSDAEFWGEFRPEGYDAIYFLSGLSGPERSFSKVETYIEINELGLANLCKACSGMGASSPYIVFPSSRLVYKGGGRVSETSLLEARSVYAANKIACEGLLSAYHHRFGINYAALRICVPYGNILGSSYSYGTVGFFIKNIKEGKPITLYGDGSISKTYTYIEDLCKIILKVSQEKIASGVYNVGGHDYTLRQIAQLLTEKFGGSIETIPWPESALRVEMGDISIDAGKLDKSLGEIQYTRFEDVIKF